MIPPVGNIFSSFDGDKFQEIDDSLYDHSETFGLGNYRGHAFTTGCSPMSSQWEYENYWGNKDSCKRKTEIMDMDTLEWDTTVWIKDMDGRYEYGRTSDYPFVSGDKYVFYVL